MCDIYKAQRLNPALLFDYLTYHLALAFNVDLGSSGDASFSVRRERGRCSFVKAG